MAERRWKSQRNSMVKTQTMIPTQASASVALAIASGIGFGTARGENEVRKEAKPRELGETVQRNNKSGFSKVMRTGDSDEHSFAVASDLWEQHKSAGLGRF